MATPTSDQIRERATQLYYSDPDRQAGYSGEGVSDIGNSPDDSSLREGGYFEEARNQLMRESANLTPEQKELALQRREELKAELSDVREALGYRPRPKRAKVEALVEAAKAPEPELAVAGTVEVASREELEAIPTPLASESLQEEAARLAAAGALPGRRERVERYPGRRIAKLAKQKQPAPEIPAAPKPPPAHKQLTASFKKAFRTTSQKLVDYERELRAQDEARRKREAEENKELQTFAREVNLAKRKRVILARATADVERERTRAEQGYGSGEAPLRGLYSAASRAVERRLAPRQPFSGLPPDLQPGYEEFREEEEESMNPYGANFGRFPSHRYPAYQFAAGRPRKRLRFRLGEPKPGERPSRGPRIRTSWKFSDAIGKSARAPSYNKGQVPYSFELVRPEDRELREAQGRISE